MSQISQCDKNDCNNMEFDNSVYHVDNETEAFLLKHFKGAFKWNESIGDICDDCIAEFNSDYEDLLLIDVRGDLSINQKYIDNHELLESK